MRWAVGNMAVSHGYTVVGAYQPLSTRTRSQSFSLSFPPTHHPLLDKGGDELPLLKGLHEHIRGHEGVEGRGERHVCAHAEVVPAHGRG